MYRPTLSILAFMLMFGLARCENNTRFLFDIVEPTGAADVQTTMATINNILNASDSTDFVFKVVGEPRVLAILNIPRLCDMSALEEELFDAKLSITVKYLYLGEKLATHLGVNKTLIESAPPPADLTGDHIYFWDAVFTMEGLTSIEYEAEIRDTLEHSLMYRLADHQLLMYRVLGQFPIQMMSFASVKPEAAEMVVWHFNRRKLFFTFKVVQVQNLDDYLNGCQ